MKHTDRLVHYDVRVRSVACDVCGDVPLFDKLSIEPNPDIDTGVRYFADKSRVIVPGWVFNGRELICPSCLEISRKVAAIRKAAESAERAATQKENE